MADSTAPGKLHAAIEAALALPEFSITELVEAMTHANPEVGWSVQPGTGRVGMHEEGNDWLEEPPEDAIWVEPEDSDEAFRDRQEFANAQSDAATRERLLTLLARPKPFRRFRAAVIDGPDPIRQAWFAFQERRRLDRAIGWLFARGLIDEATLDRARALNAPSE